MDRAVDRCRDCEFNRFGTCHALPPRDEFLAHTCKHLSVRPKVEESVEMWRERARALVESGMPVNAWCEENHVKRSILFRWLRRFRDEEPEVLGGF